MDKVYVYTIWRLPGPGTAWAPTAHLRLETRIRGVAAMLRYCQRLVAHPDVLRAHLVATRRDGSAVTVFLHTK